MINLRSPIVVRKSKFSFRNVKWQCHCVICCSAIRARHVGIVYSTVHSVRAILQWKSMKGKTKMLPNKINSITWALQGSWRHKGTSGTTEALDLGTELVVHNVPINYVQIGLQFSSCHVLSGPLCIFHVAETVRYAPVNSAPFRRCRWEAPPWAYCKDSWRG